VLEEVSRIAREAGRIAAQRSGSAFRRWEKSPNNPVCDVDLEVDAYLREHLTRLDPEAGWLSEETLDRSDRLERARLWVVDPIDGTRDYLRGRPGWCVSVALVEERVPVLGVLDAPARGEHWAVAAGEADLVATLKWGFEWDIAAAALIGAEAGATITGALGQPLAFNTASGEVFGVLAAAPGIHQAAAERLRERALALV
jgi:myo-inositol-1(or 4)-monophosphatase